MRTFLILFILILFSSCAKNAQEQRDYALDVARTMLSSGNCSGALKELKAIGNQPNDAIYLITLASAYACYANFNEISFLETDLAQHLDTTNANTIMKTLATMSLSAETAADSVGYIGIRDGLAVLLNSTASAPSQVDRDAKFNFRGGEMGVQALILSLVNLGKFLRYYGNADSVGTKGAGTATNHCFIKYNDPRAQAVVAADNTDACSSNNNGHVDLDQTTTIGKRRMCEGLMYVTNTLDILNNMDLSGNSDLAKLEQVATQVNTFKAAAVAAGLGTLINMTSQSTCETYLNTPAQLLDMEYMYSLIFESGLK